MGAVERWRGDGKLWHDDGGDRPVPAIADELGS